MKVLSLTDVMRVKRPLPVAPLGPERTAEVIVFPGLNERFSPAMLEPEPADQVAEPAS